MTITSGVRDSLVLNEFLWENKAHVPRVGGLELLLVTVGLIDLRLAR